MAAWAGTIDDLPRTIPVFPLSGVLLLPGTRLPLNIFEPRYLDMVTDARKSHGLIGMVQPSGKSRDPMTPPIYQVGGAGRIGDYRETDDGRFLITLKGIARFRIAEELAVTTAYRQVMADWTPYADDLAPGDGKEIDRERLLLGLRAYLELLGSKADWDAVAKTPTPAMVDQLALICPFPANEKQALLEAGDAYERGRVLTALIEMAVLQGAGGGETGDTPPTRN
jgi:Lon protease-like protein